ncbi:hypothetical protein TRFO_17051 [Tritrichomonas foetus]|uniref:Uncharacterized protein n=1 Tax=Tritrichomonas foetus TaxID=1144522 RepID=A0A1J4KPT1_9EUKA|nr:hypothetical protein TRFO_17051 [Tritrichomonas foetus]|eukprot:OHT12904.1 hypothetical protein TRFO_17051 [Tritrichomonas foetus]
MREANEQAKKEIEDFRKTNEKKLKDLEKQVQKDIRHKTKEMEKQTDKDLKNFKADLDGKLTEVSDLLVKTVLNVDL